MISYTAVLSRIFHSAFTRKRKEGRLISPLPGTRNDLPADQTSMIYPIAAELLFRPFGADVLTDNNRVFFYRYH